MGGQLLFGFKKAGDMKVFCRGGGKSRSSALAAPQTLTGLGCRGGIAMKKPARAGFFLRWLRGQDLNL